MYVEKNSQKRDVQGRLIAAGEKLFAEYGYKGTSVRALAKMAGCNVAAVNYYFGDKDRLYKEIWRRQLVRLREIRLLSIGKLMSDNENVPSLEELLRAFAKSFLGPLVENGKSEQLMKLITREMLEQQLPVDMFIDEVIKPTMAAMTDAMAKVCPKLDKSEMAMLLFSVVGQLLHLVRIRAMFKDATDGEMMKMDLAESVEHIVKFSAAGIRDYMEDGQ